MLWLPQASSDRRGTEAREATLMSMEIKQHLKLSQQLVMTPQLQQAIKLLQLSRTELVDMVREELLENPVLEDTVDSAAEQQRQTPGESAPVVEANAHAEVERIG